MTAPTVISPAFVVLDACFVVGYCAKEPNKFATAQHELRQYANNGCEFLLPES